MHSRGSVISKGRGGGLPKIRVERTWRPEHARSVGPVSFLVQQDILKWF